MPYIKQERRLPQDISNPENIMGGIWAHGFEGPGDLNYLFTVLIMDYIKQKGLSYQTINDVIGALQGADREFYRRIAVPYEDMKLSVNGDVYTK